MAESALPVMRSFFKLLTSVLNRRSLAASTLLVAVPVVSACTRSVPGQGEGTFLDTAAQTLTAAPTSPPSATLPPSATPPSSATAPATSTSPPTSSPTAGPSPSPTPPPLPEGDPRTGLNLAAPDIQDQFSQRYGWFEYSDRNAATITWQRGQLTTVDHLPDGFVWWSTSGHTASDFYAEVTAQVEACSGKDAYGLAVRIGGTGYDRGYTIEFSCDGHYRLRRFVSGELPETILPWTESDLIRSGPDASNRLGFLARGSELAAFANGDLLTEEQDPSYVFGNFGLFADALTQQDLTVHFSEFSLWFVESQ